MTFNKFIQDYQPGCTCEVQDHVLTKWVFYGLEGLIWSSNYTWKIHTYRKSYIKVSNKCYTDLKWMSANYLFPNIISKKQCFSIWTIERWGGEVLLNNLTSELYQNEILNPGSSQLDWLWQRSLKKYSDVSFVLKCTCILTTCENKKTERNI